MADGRRLARQVTTESSTLTDVVYSPKVAYDRQSRSPITVLCKADSGAALSWCCALQRLCEPTLDLCSRIRRPTTGSALVSSFRRTPAHRRLARHAEFPARSLAAERAPCLGRPGRSRRDAGSRSPT